MAYCVQICVIFCGLLQFLGSSVGRAADFGSVDPNWSGPWVALGTKFFFSFFAEKCCETPPSGQNLPYGCSSTVLHTKIGLKNTFFLITATENY